MADTITELKLGNGTSVLIFANIASALPTSVGGAISQVRPALSKGMSHVINVQRSFGVDGLKFPCQGIGCSNACRKGP